MVNTKEVYTWSSPPSFAPVKTGGCGLDAQLGVSRAVPAFAGMTNGLRYIHALKTCATLISFLIHGRTIAR